MYIDDLGANSDLLLANRICLEFVRICSDLFVFLTLENKINGECLWEGRGESL